MKIQKTTKWMTAFAAVCLAASAFTARAQDWIGVNFVANDNAAGETGVGTCEQDSYVDSLLPSELAGVIAISNWNNVGVMCSDLNLKEASNGLPSNVYISWTLQDLGMWHSDAQTGFPLPLSGDSKLMDGFLETTWGWTSPNSAIPPGTAVTNIANNAATIYLTGLSQFLVKQGGGQYSIILYCNNDSASGRISSYWLQAVTGNSQGITLGITNPPAVGVTNVAQYFLNDNAQFTGTYVQAPASATNQANAADFNYILWKGLTNDQIIIRTQNIEGGPASAVCGIEIIAAGLRVPPGPTAPTITPTNVVFAGSPVVVSEFLSQGTPPVSYQWATNVNGNATYTTNASTSTVDNTFTVIPPNTGSTYTINFECICSNQFGANVSTNTTLTVLPANQPILTTDIPQFNTNVVAFIGGNVTFNANFALGSMPITNQWIGNTGSGYAPVAGGTNNPWTLTNVQLSSVGFYKLSATNAIGSSNSTPAHLAALADPATPSGIGMTNMYSYCVMTNHPWAYWKFEETNDTFEESMQAYDYSGHNFDATYGNSDPGDFVQASGCFDGGESLANLQSGPNTAAGYPGFPNGNTCAGMQYDVDSGNLTVPPLNFNTNTVTFTMWIYPNQPHTIAASSGLLMYRNNADAAGVGFSSNVNTNGEASLGYTWNQNSATTYGWDSKLYPPGQQWSFVAYVISPARTAVYLYYVNSKTNLQSAVNSVTNASEAFVAPGTTWIGGDNWNNARNFDGYIDEVSVFTNAMTENQIQDLFLKSLGLNSGIAPVFTTQPPATTTTFQGQLLQIACNASGIPTPNYFWQALNGATWTTLGGIGGVQDTNNVLSWTNCPDAFTSYRCIATNYYGSATSTVATVSVIPVARWNSAEWTVNFNVKAPNNSAPYQAYYGRALLGTNLYWNGLSGGLFANSQPTYMDDGVTPCPVNVAATNYNGNWGTQTPWNSILFDQYMQVGTNGTSMILTNIPVGRYNLALYGIDASYVNRGVVFTVLTNGVSAGTQTVTNAQDILMLPDNTVLFTNLLLTSGSMEVHMLPAPSVPQYPGTNNEGDFNGLSLEMISGPYVLSLTNKQGTNFALSFVGGKLLQSTNMNGPWTTNTTATSPFTINPTGAQRFFRVYTNNF